jgi:UDP-glucose 4-epimerase
VTGAGGYIGLHVVRHLVEDGQDVTAVVRSVGKLGPFARNSRVRVVETDLAREPRFAHLLAGHDVCVHAAVIWGDPGSELELRDTAVAAKLFDAAGTARVKRCIYLSSVAVHRPFRGVMDEDSCLSGTDSYGATKAAGELFLRAACATHQMSGVVVRPGPVVGPPAFAAGSFRSDNRIADMVVAASAGHPIDAGRGEGRQFSDVSMIATVVCTLTHRVDPYQSYICVDRNVITWERVAQLVVRTLNSPSQVRVRPTETETIPRFRTERCEELYGSPAHAESALSAHIRHLGTRLKEQHAESR